MGGRLVFDGTRLSLSEDAIDRAVSKIGPGLAKYLWIQEHYLHVNVSQDRNFQRRFNGFYRVRRGPEWQHAFYQLMEESKSGGISFPTALASLSDVTGRLETSFASKLAATLDPTLPVVDRFILQNFGLRLPYPYETGRQEKVRRIYTDLQDRYRSLMSSETGRLISEKVTEMYPQARLSELKKIDLVLWQNRD